jgi:threonine dehydratase
MKLVVEPTGALAAAAVMEGLVDVRGKRVGVVLSGGNVDLDQVGGWRARLIPRCGDSGPARPA